MQNIKPGSLLNNGKYRVDLAIGQGGFGITYLGQHTILYNKVAIKEYFPQQYCDRDDHSNNIVAKSTSSAKEMARFRAKFIKEAITLSKLSHPNIVRILDVFEDNGSAYFVMDFVDGMTLKDMVECEPLPIDRAIDYVRHIAEALDHIHAKRINHLDIKPANIIVRASDNQPILIDFGLAKNFDSQGAQTSATPIGVSRGYAPLEQYTGAIESFSPESDLYSLGATLYKIITGINPPEPSTILNVGHIDFPDFVPDAIRDIITKAMSVSKAQRYHTAKEIIADLDKSMCPPAEPESETIPAVEPETEPEEVAETVAIVENRNEEEPAREVYIPTPIAHSADATEEEPVAKEEHTVVEEKPVAEEEHAVVEAPEQEEFEMKEEAEPETEPETEAEAKTNEPENETNVSSETDSNEIDIDAPAETDSEEPTVTTDYEEEPETVTDTPSAPADESESSESSDTEISGDISESKAPVEENPVSATDSKKTKAKSKRGILLVIVIFIVAIAAGAAAYYFWSLGNSGGSSTDADTTDVVENTKATEETNGPVTVSGMPFTISGISGLYTGTLNADSVPDMKTDAYVKFNDKTYDYYKGDIAGGKITGHGFLRAADGTTFEGTFNDGEILDGEIRYSSGESYKGTFKNNEFFNGTYFDKTGKALYKYVNGKES